MGGDSPGSFPCPRHRARQRGLSLAARREGFHRRAFARQLGDRGGQVFAIFVITVAAGEAAIGLGIIVAVYRMKGTVEADTVRELEG